MKILYLHQYFNLPYMLGSTRSFELASSLVDAGYNVEVITSMREWGYHYPENFNDIRIDWIDIPYSNSFGYWKRLFAFLKYICLTTIKVLSKDYDLIYVSSTPLTVLVPALVAKIFRRKKYIFEVRDMWPEIPIAMGYIKSNLIKSITEKLAYFGYVYSEFNIVLSNDMAEQISGRYSVDHSKIYVLPNFSSSNYFQFCRVEILNLRKKITDNIEHKIIIYPGTFGHVNGVDYITSLAMELRNSKYFFLAIGSGKELGNIRQIKNDKKLKNLLIMDGVPKSDVYKFIAASDYLISTVIDIPELNWNSANKYFDGLCAGKPVIINYGGWQATELLTFNSGIILDRDVEVAASALKSITDEQYYLMQENACWLARKYQKEKIQKRLINILKNEEKISNMY